MHMRNGFHSPVLGQDYTARTRKGGLPMGDQFIFGDCAKRKENPLTEVLLKVQLWISIYFSQCHYEDE